MCMRGIKVERPACFAIAFIALPFAIASEEAPSSVDRGNLKVDGGGIGAASVDEVDPLAWHILSLSLLLFSSSSFALWIKTLKGV